MIKVPIGGYNIFPSLADITYALEHGFGFDSYDLYPKYGTWPVPLVDTELISGLGIFINPENTKPLYLISQERQKLYVLNESDLDKISEIINKKTLCLTIEFETLFDPDFDLLRNVTNANF